MHSTVHAFKKKSFLITGKRLVDPYLFLKQSYFHFRTKYMDRVDTV